MPEWKINYRKSDKDTGPNRRIRFKGLQDYIEASTIEKAIKKIKKECSFDIEITLIKQIEHFEE